MNEPRPTGRAIAPREYELCVSQLRIGGADPLGMVLAQFDDRIRIAGVNGAKKFLGLTMKLV